MTADPGQNLLLLVGPTGVGKTEISLYLATMLSGEIVSADSRLVYRLMDIGTAKPNSVMRDKVPHHMVDIVAPDDEYTSKRFELEARKVVRGILKRGRVPIAVGGSGLYVRALLNGIFDGPARDDSIRKRLRAAAGAEGKLTLWRRLAAVDPEKAKQIGPANQVRLIRALEVYELTGRPMSQLERGAKPFEVPCKKVGLTRSRNELYEIIDGRIDGMMEAGFVDEVKSLVSDGYGAAPSVRRSLGYREILEYLEGALTLQEAVRLLKRNTRRFAKRQMTWFRKEKSITWMDITGRHDYEKIAGEIALQFLGVKS